jgi:hypothetical protein
LSDLYRVLLLFLAVAAVIVPLFVGRKLDRRRIHEHVEANGGKVIDVARRWFGGRGGGRYMNAYDVTYKSRDGKRVTATCITSMTRGVYWISDRPPDGMETSEEAEAADESLLRPPGPQCLLWRKHPSNATMLWDGIRVFA